MLRSGSWARYADDFAACCFTEQQAEGIRERLTGWLAERARPGTEDKTQGRAPSPRGSISPAWTFRRFPSGKLLMTRRGQPIPGGTGKSLRATRGARAGSWNAMAVIAHAHPGYTRGSTAHHRGMVSSGVFSSLNQYAWQLTYKRARQPHPTSRAGLWPRALWAV